MKQPLQASNGSPKSRDKITVSIPINTSLDLLAEKSTGDHAKQPEMKKNGSSIVEKPEKEKGRVEQTPKFVLVREYLQKRYDFRINTILMNLEHRLKNERVWSVLNENDLICELLEAGFTGIDKMLLAFLASNHIARYNPCKVYFEGLDPWKPGDADHIAKLAGFVEAKDPDWFLLQFRKMLVRSAACVLGKIPFNKHCFTLVGKQNDGKTSFLRFLCPPALSDYFKENLDIQNKDGRLALCQNFFINLDELATLSRHDINQIKSFFTIDKVKERLPYARKPETFPRIASFVASTNKSEFLTDETGNVRWLVFETESIRHDNGGKNGYEANVNIDQVWAQVFYLLQSGFNFNLTPEELAKSELNNRNFQLTTAEMDLISRWYAPGKKTDVFLTAADIEEQLGSLTNGRVRVNRVNIGKALQMLGFEQCQKFIPAFKQQRKGYYVVQKFTVEEKTSIGDVTDE